MQNIYRLLWTDRLTDGLTDRPLFLNINKGHSSSLSLSLSYDLIFSVAADTCRYEIHTSALSWEKAVQACRQRGLTLASLSNQNEATSIYSALKRAESVYSEYNDKIDDE